MNALEEGEIQQDAEMTEESDSVEEVNLVNILTVFSGQCLLFYSIKQDSEYDKESESSDHSSVENLEESDHSLAADSTDGNIDLVKDH